MNGPSAPSSGASDAMKLLELLADKDRAAETIKAHDDAKTAAEAAIGRLEEYRKELAAVSADLATRVEDVKRREDEAASKDAESARKRDGDLRELEGQRAATTALAKEMTDRKVAFEQEWATADANQRSRTVALDERERLLVLREETVKAKEAVLGADREAYERDRTALDARQSNLRRLLEQG